MNRIASVVAIIVFQAVISPAAELAVGPGQAFDRIEEALAKANSGDLILVHPRADGVPYTKVALSISKNRITLRGVTSATGQRVALNGTGFDYNGRGNTPRAIIQFNPGADGSLVEGFELSGAHNESHNGAGFRINQANQITIRHCWIHNNDMGIMSNGDGTNKSAVDQLIEGCLLHSNGDRTEPGYNHNLYLGGTSVTLAGCEVHSSLTGHNVKSRAHQTFVLGCYIHDSSNRELDLVDGKSDTAAEQSHAVLAGNVIVKSAACEGNKGVIQFGQDGGHEHDGTLYLIQNTIITPYISPVVTLSAPKARLFLQNNIFYDNASGRRGQQLVAASAAIQLTQAVTGNCNWFSAGFGGSELEKLKLEKSYFAKSGQRLAFLDPVQGNYRLKPEPTISGKGAPLDPALLQLMGGKLYQYQSGQHRIERALSPTPDLGAYDCRSATP